MSKKKEGQQNNKVDFSFQDVDNGTLSCLIDRERLLLCQIPFQIPRDALTL